MAVGVLKSYILEEAIVGVDNNRGSDTHMESVVSSAEFVVEDHSFVTVLSDDVDEWFCGGYVHVFFVISVLDEDEPGFHTACRGSIDGVLHSGVVSATVSSHYSIVETSFRLATFESGESEGGACKWVSAAVGDGTFRYVESVSCAVIKAGVLVDDSLAAHYRQENHTVESGIPCAYLYLFIECEDDRACR